MSHDQRPSTPPAELVLDALRAPLAVLHPDGTLVRTNAAWNALAQSAGAAAPAPVVPDYLAACRAASAHDTQAGEIAAGLARVLDGGATTFSLAFCCMVAGRARAYLLEAGTVPDGFVVLSLTDYTREIDTAATVAARQEADATTAEFDSLVRLSSPAPAPATARTFGHEPLSTSAAAAYGDVVERYAELLDGAVDRAVYKDGELPRERVRALAEQFGRLHAGPRDVVDVHRQALRARFEKYPARRTAFMRESRLVALEVMGLLAAYYRRRAGHGSVPPGEAHP